jgi:signal transduction histidine kinase/DNA-binding response OmpR family regulator
MAMILVVDDRPSNREFLVTLLGYAGYRLLEASDGAEALEVVQRERPELVIADLVMPTMDGYEFVRQLRADPAVAQTQVIFYTATYLQSEAWALAQSCGVQHILTKPAEPEVVLSTVQAVLGRTDQPLPTLSSDEFDREHMRVMTDKLARQVEALEQEVAERKRAEAALQQEAQISTALARVGRELIASLDAAAIRDSLCRLTTEMLGCDCSHILLWQPTSDLYVPVAGYGDTPEQWEVLRGFSVPRLALTELLGRLEDMEVLEVVTAAPQHLLPTAPLRQANVTVALWVALRWGGNIIGILSAGYKGRLAPFTSQHERIAKGVAQLASLALTNAKLFEELQGANQLKLDFLATMSHELRTPLNVVLGYTDLLLDGEFGSLATEQDAVLQRVRRATVQEVDLVSALLNVTQLEAGRLPVEWVRVDVGTLVAELQHEADVEGQEPHLQFIWRAAPGLPRLRTDRAKLKIILQNLLRNALKFTEQGSISVEVKQQGGGVEFRVTDTGIGIAPEMIPEIFAMFRQGDNSTTRRYGGIGLGLYIVRRLLDLIGGTVEVESEVGKGSTFRVWVPQQAEGDQENRTRA